MKSVVALIGVGVVILMLGAIMLALGSFRGADFAEPHIVLSGETSTVIVLANDVLDDSTTNIGILSTSANDAPVPYLYTAGDHHLTINGLSESDNRTLTITYKVPRLDDFSDIVARFFPMFMVLAGVCIVVGAAVSAFRH